MAVRNDFTAGEVLAAADLNDTFAAKLNLAGGKILQIVRATDTTARNTTSTSFVDVTGMSVTIAPQRSTSAIIIVAVGFSVAFSLGDGQNHVIFAITDSSNNVISGAENMSLGVTDFTGANTRITRNNLNMWGYITPATTSAITYKLRFKVEAASTTGQCSNASNTGQMYAIEVSA
jgi:hypothetical protein